MKAAYLKSPFQFEIRTFEEQLPDEDQIRVKVKACGVCGTDLHSAATSAPDWKPFGHEISGIVEEVGKHVDNVKAGQKVVLESGTFDRYSAVVRNGNPELDNKGPNYWETQPMGFADYITVPKEVAVPFEGISFEEASIVEPLGVALDLVYTADIKINDDVVVVGLGPIGLLALRLAKLMGARKVYGVEYSMAERRVEIAKQYGAEDIVHADKMDFKDYQYPRGGVDKVLVTAPPKVIPNAIDILNWGGNVSFIGIEYGDDGRISFDANEFHFKKIQLRASFASPALYFPRCLELIESKAIDVKPLISDRFKLEEIEKAMMRLRDDKKNAVKAIMINE